MAFIDELISLSRMPVGELPADTLALARLSLLDWMVCGIAGANEPVADKMRTFAALESGSGVASIIGGGTAPARMAAMVNGATSHALDYDDTHFGHVGHLSVGIYPAVMAVAEELDVSATRMTEAFILGAEAAIRIGMAFGRSHYNHGFHQTATAGSFGATLAVARILNLKAHQLRNALGLCSTRASGLKSQFGTMGKPYNAGIAAANGVECARLAGLGVTSADDGLMGPQGFAATHAAQIDLDTRPPDGKFLFRDNKYKLHACCHGTHAMIEALLEAVALEGIAFNDVASFSLTTNPRWLLVCDIKAPRTGLEIKFSYNWLAGMALRGDRTGDDRIYSDELAVDEALRTFASKVTVTGDEGVSDLEAKGELTLHDGRKIPVMHDLALPLTEEALAAKLRNKAVAILGETGQRLWSRFELLDAITARELGQYLRDRK